MSSTLGLCETLCYCLEETPFGWLALLGSAESLRRVSLQPEPQEALDGLGDGVNGAEDNPAVFADALAAFGEYFGGNVTALDGIPLDLSNASPFFGAAWAACRGIPAGETRSYQWLAEAAGNSKASRAAGQAMAKNPFPLIIPCHRVVGSTGSLHGYGAGGIGVKARLLEMERQQGTML